MKADGLISDTDSLKDVAVVSRERLMGELALLLPVLSREIGKSWPKQGIEISELTGCDVGVSGSLAPGHVQVLISLSGGARSVGAIAGEVGVSSPAVTQFVDRLVEYGIVERRSDERDGRVVLVDYVEDMRGMAREILDAYRRHLEEIVGGMSDEEIRAFVKGMKLLVAGAGNFEKYVRRISESEISSGGNAR